MPTDLLDSEREKGTYFEQLTKVWLENAPTQRAQFKRVLTFADWANENRQDQRALLTVHTNVMPPVS